ncbi:MAG: ATPase [Streptosporangiales bacterium]|nr:ATPase [Streptosporangiales bacterium]
MTRYRDGNLPAALSSLIGRAEETEEILHLLTGYRLVTLTGVGGVGKTRLALRVAERLSADLSDGAWLIELSELREPELLEHVIAETLGFSDQTTLPPSELLAARLAGRRLLLVLDTCEHLVDACSDLATELLAGCPGLTIIATSRRPLSAPDEYVYTVPPLLVSAEGDAPGDAELLFAERAAETVPKFTLTEGRREAVRELCHRLDGIPLAIELAAVRLRTMSPEQLRSRMRSRLPLLAGGRRTDVARHRTLRAAIGWSHELCEPVERLLWARLSVFAGDFDVPAAAAVCCDDQIPEVVLPELLDGLVEESILLRAPVDGCGPRYRLIGTLREYGAEWLAALGERHTVRRRHVDHYLRLARQGDTDWLGPEQLTWYERMVREQSEIQVALEVCLAEPDGERGLELAGALWFFWFGCGFMRDGRRYLKRLLEANPEPSPARSKAMWVYALVITYQGETAAADALARQASDDPTQAAVAGAVAANAALLAGDLERAKALAERALTRQRELGDTGLARFLAPLVLAFTTAAEGDLPGAAVLLADMRAESERRGEVWARTYADFVDGSTALARGDGVTAGRYGRIALRDKWRIHDLLGAAVILDLLAKAACLTGEKRRAALLLGVAHRAWATFGGDRLGVPFLVEQAEECQRRTRKELGEKGFQAAYDAGRDLDLPAGVTYALGGGGPTGPATRRVS